MPCCWRTRACTTIIRTSRRRGYYNRIIAGNINQVLKVDSVVCDFNAYPYRAVTYATQKIIRQSNVTERSLVTTCRLLNASAVG